ncbi:MAG: exodeoxyribonuclease III, partial [Bacteroidetes bacterium]|nr:exodeoxyribonuclease III [Bacteroidota bacterium]
MKIATYNVNGIRSALSKGLLDWVQAASPDVLCVQEIKSTAEQIAADEFEKLGYKSYAFPAQKKGYSGVAVFTRTEPDQVVYGMGNERYDSEGRTIRLDFGNLTLINTYFPSGSSGDERQAFKMEFLADYQNYINELAKERPQLVVCGDYNICHRSIDIHNPVSNKNSSGFLPEEREWMEQFLNSGFVDSFRHLNPDPHHYTWWSFRAGARNKNLGWRIDYICLSQSLSNSLVSSRILPDARHSDHCPVI